MRLFAHTWKVLHGFFDNKRSGEAIGLMYLMAVSSSYVGRRASPVDTPAPATPALADDDLLGRFVDEMPFLYGFVQRMGSPAADRDDIIQEVFLVFHRRRGDFDAGRPLRPWLTGIAYRLTLTHRRHGREIATGSVAPHDERGRSPEEDLVRKQSADLVWRALQKLPAKQRAVFILHEIQGLDVVDVARAVRVPRFTVYSRLREGRRGFAATVKRLMGEDGEHAHE